MALLYMLFPRVLQMNLCFWEQEFLVLIPPQQQHFSPVLLHILYLEMIAKRPLQLTLKVCYWIILVSFGTKVCKRAEQHQILLWQGIGNMADLSPTTRKDIPKIEEWIAVDA